MKSNIQLHLRENNKSSQSHLEKNAARFSRQCLIVLLLMYRGKRLNTENAPAIGIRSLPRRIKDLRDRNGIKVKDEWRTDCDGNKIDKEWFIDIRVRRKTKKEVIESWKKRLKFLNHQ